MEYYYLPDLNKVGKMDNFVPYLYELDKGWMIDKSNILMDRIIGYDGESIGSSSQLFQIQQITEEEANAKIEKLSIN